MNGGGQRAQLPCQEHGEDHEHPALVVFIDLALALVCERLQLEQDRRYWSWPCSTWAMTEPRSLRNVARRTSSVFALRRRALLPC